MSALQNFDRLPINIILNRSLWGIIDDKPHGLTEKGDNALEPLQPKPCLKKGLANEAGSRLGQIKVNSQETRSTGEQGKRDLCRYFSLSDDDGVRLESGSP